MLPIFVDVFHATLCILARKCMRESRTGLKFGQIRSQAAGLAALSVLKRNPTGL